MRSTGERIAEFAAGALTAIVFMILYAPLIIGVLFSVVRDQAGQDPLGDVQRQSLCDLVVE